MSVKVLINYLQEISFLLQEAFQKVNMHLDEALRLKKLYNFAIWKNGQG